MLKTALTISQTTVLDYSKLRKFADDNFKFDENGRKFSKRVKNTVGKGEIAHDEQFLLFPQCFKRHVQKIHKNQGLFGKGLKTIQHCTVITLDLPLFVWFQYYHKYSPVYNIPSHREACFPTLSPPRCLKACTSDRYSHIYNLQGTTTYPINPLAADKNFSLSESKTFYSC